MPVEVLIDGGDHLRPDQRAALGDGAFDGEQVWVEFVTQGDNRVRPTHAALQGSVWRADDPNAPAPPLDFGCRCQLRYVAKPGSTAAQVFPVAEAVPMTRPEVYARYLDTHLPEWRQIAAAAAKVPPAARLDAAYLALKELRPDVSDARELARMAVEAAPAAGA